MVFFYCCTIETTRLVQESCWSWRSNDILSVVQRVNRLNLCALGNEFEFWLHLSIFREKLCRDGIYLLCFSCSLSPSYMHTNMSSPKHFYFNLAVTITLLFLEIDNFFCSHMCVELIVLGCCLSVVCVCVCVCVWARQGQSQLPGIQEFYPFFPQFFTEQWKLSLLKQNVVF